MVELSLTFEDNGTGHDDLILRFAGSIWRCDSYYLALDNLMLPEQSDAEKIRQVLRKLIEQWISTIQVVQTLPEGGRVYLPFDFSDQYTGWLSCARFGDNITISCGWSDVEGWLLAPSDIGCPVFSLSNFRVTGLTAHVPAKALIETLQNLIVEWHSDKKLTNFCGRGASLEKENLM